MLTQTPSDFDYAFRAAARLVAAVFDVEPAVLVGPKKGSPHVVHARQVFAYLLYTDGQGWGSVAIARAMDRHHSTVWHSIQKMVAMRDDEEIDASLTRLGDMFADLVAAHARIPELVEILGA
jgi:chromosomal replication initiation ATPase DnaA